MSLVEKRSTFSAVLLRSCRSLYRRKIPEAWQRISADFQRAGFLQPSGEADLHSPFKNAPSWPDIADPADATTLPPELGTLLDVESFSTATTYDALNRTTQTTLPSGTASGNHVATPAYNRTGLLQTMAVQFAGDAAPTTFVTNIAYNEKDQRLQIAYGNGVTTAYSYEPDSFRLSTIATTRTAPADLQALSYTYDPVGNITTIRDRAQQTLFFANRIVEPSTNYAYDAIYRLTNAVGRDHAGQAAPDQLSVPQGAPLPNPNDTQAMRQYSESYQYDSVGNFLAMVHAATNAQGLFQNVWTRAYTPDTASNRLLSTALGSTTTPYPHDAAGNMTRLPQLAAIDWDYKNQMSHAALGGGGDVYFAYDAAGQRVRKVLVQGATTKERIYLGAYEIYRERSASGSVSLERRTLHVTDDKRRIALVELRTAGDDGSPVRLLRYQLDNHLGSAALELDATASLLSYEEYHPYGTIAYRATAAALATNPKRYAFTANERDDEIGLYRIGVRYVAPWLGRWMSPDPAGRVDGSNLYIFSCNNSIRLKDVTGRKSQDEVRTISRGKRGSITLPSASDIVVRSAHAHVVLPQESDIKISTRDHTTISKESETKDSQERDSTRITGGYGFLGILPHPDSHRAVNVHGEGLGLVGYDREKGWYGATLAGGGFSLHNPGLRLKEAEATLATESSYYFRSGKGERESLILGDVGLGKLRGFDFGVGGFVNKRDPREVGFYGYIGLGSAVAGGGLTLHLKVDAVSIMREELSRTGVELVQVPPAQLRERDFWQQWIRLPDFMRRWIASDAKSVARSLEQRGIDVRFEHGEQVLK